MEAVKRLSEGKDVFVWFPKAMKSPYATRYYGVPFVSKLKKKWVFIYPALDLYIQPGIYISSQVFINPASISDKLHVIVHDAGVIV